MTINNLPGNLGLLIQSNFLLRFYNDALQPAKVYRGMMDSFETPRQLGENFTFTKKGLLAVKRAPIPPALNTDLSSGLNSEAVGYEQYGVTMNQYGNMTMVNMLSDSLALDGLFASAVEDLGLNAGRTLDLSVRGTLFRAYNGFRTYATSAVTADDEVIVQNMFGFDFTYVNGVRTATSALNPHPVTVTQSGVPASRNVTLVVGGTVNDSEEIRPGTLTLDANVTMIVGDTIVSAYAPTSIRPNGKTSSFSIGANDIMVLQNLVDATARLKASGVKPRNGRHYCAILDAGQVAQLFKDNAFQRVYDTHSDSTEFQMGAVGIAGGVEIYVSQETPNGVNPSGQYVRRGIIIGDEPGYEARAQVNANWLTEPQFTNNGAVQFSPETYSAMIFRQPLDVLQQVVTIAWSFIGDWVCATDTLTSFGNNNGIYKRAIVLETA